ncbi:hypothetical protein BOTBODRAFT_648400 [Botryobasidium botryosum FD-172 SS1]|uniref:PIN domain-containing protein n=1 Tax=Botryobasidium botryosum (strain FD-172 SS1) TaxID=930990 RepID=A0A067MR50_BOTB1|nr:hypothetical protein BOTBODRAFT_648400 [Botryobasidium botryosum FD-172 SS1]
MRDGLGELENNISSRGRWMQIPEVLPGTISNSPQSTTSSTLYLIFFNLLKRCGRNEQRPTKKLMNLHTHSFGFRQPYQVLIDSTFCENGTQQKIEIERMLDIVLQGKGKPMITQCCMVELYELGLTSQSVAEVRAEEV